ncbi:MAG: hypothetical protein HY054_15410 [Proteobacteria bacterium]|nr:hypothetical protein [Pseudomonadota bacterium]
MALDWRKFAKSTASVPYVCVRCRRSFKRRVDWPLPETLPCSHCGAEAIRVSTKFKPPPRQKLDQWEKVSLLLRAGYRFESVNDDYPKTLAELPKFLANNQPRSIKPYDN